MSKKCRKSTFLNNLILIYLIFKLVKTHKKLDFFWFKKIDFEFLLLKFKLKVLFEYKK